MRNAIELPHVLKCTDHQWRSANKQVVWGWKRDEGLLQRLIFFSGCLGKRAGGELRLSDWCFFYRHRANADAIDGLMSDLDCAAIRQMIGTPRLTPCRQSASLGIVELAGGPGLSKRWPMIHRLLQRRPRRTLPVGEFPKPQTTPLKVEVLRPIALYAGSGLSYEAGLPTLAQVHETFGVDRLNDAGFSFGKKDRIPRELREDLIGTFGRFVGLNVQAAAAKPAQSHRIVAQWVKRGLIKNVYTDNVDNIFSQCGVKFERTRGLGIFNDPFPIRTAGLRTLIAIGVAADRRSIISEARKSGCRIVVVNPMKPVSPRSQNLSYLKPHDLWYRMEASEFCDLHGSWLNGDHS